MTPAVSIVVPTYDRPDHLARALRSCLRQTSPPEEVLVMDNGQNPKTATTVAAAAENAAVPIRHVRCEPFNLRGALARGIEMAAAEWLILLDDDDFLLDDRIAGDRETIHGLPGDVILLVHDFLRADYKSRIVWAHRMADKPLGLREALVLDHFPPPPAGTWRTAALRRHHSFHLPEGWTDFDLYASALPFGRAEKSGRFGYVMDDTRAPGRLTTDVKQTLKMVDLHRRRFAEYRRFLGENGETVGKRLDEQEAFFAAKSLGFRAFLGSAGRQCRRHPKETLKGVLAPLRALASRYCGPALPRMRGSKSYSFKQFARLCPDLSATIEAERLRSK